MLTREKMTRAEFTPKVWDQIAEMVNYICVMPGCETSGRFPSQDGSRMISVGVRAHASAAQEGGPRFKPEWTDEQRKALDNGVYLCATHARQVDVDEAAFPVELMQQWQREKVLQLAASGGKPPRRANYNVAESNQKVDDFLALCAKVSANVNQHVPYIELRSIQAIEEVLRACHCNPRTGIPAAYWKAGSAYHAQDSHAFEIQKNALSALGGLFSEIKCDGSEWFYDRDRQAYYPIALFHFPVNQAKAMAVINLAKERLDRFYHALQELRLYTSNENTRTR
ncbi:hypothetical protein [Duganella caerulea]|uniref:hypothetical protein n=1 Tax=Duganella caerulea TaxID=2885762 RepID=UPI0040382BE9